MLVLTLGFTGADAVSAAGSVPTQDPTASIATLKAAARQNPEQASARIALARAYFLKGKTAKSRRLLRQALSDDPSAADRDRATAYLAAIDLQRNANRRWKTAPETDLPLMDLPGTGPYSVHTTGTATLQDPSHDVTRDEAFAFSSAVRVNRTLTTQASGRDQLAAYAELYAKGDDRSGYTPDEHTIGLNTGLRFTTAETTAQLRPTFSARYKDSRHINLRYGLTTDVRQRLSDQTALFGAASVTRTEDKTRNGSDTGTVKMNMGLTQRFAIPGSVSFSLFGEAKTKSDPVDDELTIGLESFGSVTLSNGIVLKPTVFAEQTHHPHAVDGPDAEPEYRAGLRLRLNLPDATEETSTDLVFALEHLDRGYSGPDEDPDETTFRFQLSRRF